MSRKNPPPLSRRARGTGTIFRAVRRGREVWIGRVPVGRRLTGQTKYREVWAATQRELVERMRGVTAPADDTTVAEWAERWWRQSTVEPSTREDYRKCLDSFIIPTLGHLAVVSVTSHQVEEAAKRWLTRTNPNTTRKNLSILSACMSAARRAELIAVNPVKDAKRPKPKRVATDIFTADELGRIIDAARAHPIALLAAVGCRLGEALALDVADFDPATGMVSITKTYDRKFGIRKPKSENSVRTIRVPGPARPALEAAIGSRARGPLFVNRDGLRWKPDAFYKVCRLMLARLGLTYRRPHTLRHSFASLMIARGMSIPDLGNYLGDSPHTIFRVYAHPTWADVAGEMERAIGGRAVKTRRA